MNPHTALADGLAQPDTVKAGIIPTCGPTVAPPIPEIFAAINALEEAVGALNESAHLLTTRIEPALRTADTETRNDPDSRPETGVAIADNVYDITERIRVIGRRLADADRRVAL